MSVRYPDNVELPLLVVCTESLEFENGLTSTQLCTCDGVYKYIDADGLAEPI